MLCKRSALLVWLPRAQWVGLGCRRTKDDERCDAVGEREVFV
jgi:hypothetical protein